MSAFQIIPAKGTMSLSADATKFRVEKLCKKCLGVGSIWRVMPAPAGEFICPVCEGTGKRREGA